MKQSTFAGVEPMRVFSTGEVCKMLGIQQENLCYWERVGKIPPVQRMGNGKRIFHPADVAKLRKLLRRLSKP